jgi:Zn-dependent protease with chaperone function
MDLSTLRYRRERPLFVLSLVLSIIAWLAIAITIVGLAYVVIGALVYWVAQALMLATIKGNGVKITSTQLPDLHRRIEAIAQKLELTPVPEAYLLNQRAGFNALATRFLGRNFVIFYADLLEACDENPGAADFIVGHELGHFALGHLRTRMVLLPSLIVPLVGPAYSRACEYSCDMVGQAVVDKPETAVSGLTVLAAGGLFAKQLSLDALVEQSKANGVFWQAIVELNSSHPFLAKRVAALRRVQNAAPVASVGRNPFAYVLAPFFAFSGASFSGALIIIAIVGILAAIAIPNLARFQQRVREAAASRQQRQPSESWRAGESPARMETLPPPGGDGLANPDAAAFGQAPAEDNSAANVATKPLRPMKKARKAKAGKALRSLPAPMPMPMPAPMPAPTP